MTSYAAYDEGLPCKNPNCKSRGKPHPNCHCYGAMAEGGEVGHFCDQKKRHNIGCEHYADGGTVEEPLHPDPHHSVAAFLAAEGLHNLIKMGPGDPHDLLEKYNLSVKRGKKHFEKRVACLFDGGVIESQDHTKSRKAIHDWISKGGTTQDIEDVIHSHHEAQHFAEGGHVENKPAPVLEAHPVAKAYPEQNLMLQAAKGRMSDYLNGLKPQEHGAKLAFDRKPDDKSQKRTYQKALQIAAHPLSVLEDLKKGRLSPEELTHLKNLHPEVNEVLQQKLTERVTKEQLDHKRPGLKVREGLSLMLGAPLSSEFTPGSMQAIQATFQNKQAPQQPGQAPGKPKKSTSGLSDVDDSYMTGTQSRVARQQHQKS